MNPGVSWTLMGKPQLLLNPRGGPTLSLGVGMGQKRRGEPWEEGNQGLSWQRGAHRQRLRGVRAGCLRGPLCIALSRRRPLRRAKGALLAPQSVQSFLEDDREPWNAPS